MQKPILQSLLKLIICKIGLFYMVAPHLPPKTYSKRKIKDKNLKETFV